MGLLIGLGVVAIIIIVVFIVFQAKGGISFPWFQFYAKGKESGFNFKEISLLRKAAVDITLDNPTSLFWSVRQLDKTIKGVIIKARANTKIDTPEVQNFVANLYDFRKRVEFNTPKYKIGLKTTRDLLQSQKFRINLPGGGTFHSSLIDNLRKYMAISYPQSPDRKLPPGFSWKGQVLNIYFWRADDAGYFFEAKVLEDYLDQKFPILHISHSDNLVRSQKRRSIRCECNIGVNIYNLSTIEGSNEIQERTPGLKGRLVDISEDGAAILVGGRAKVGLPIKIQFTLSDFPLIMCGIVKGITFDPKKNRSVLHIQAATPSARIRNSILSYVYNIFEERKEIRKRMPLL